MELKTVLVHSTPVAILRTGSKAIVLMILLEHVPIEQTTEHAVATFPKVVSFPAETELQAAFKMDIWVRMEFQTVQMAKPAERVILARDMYEVRANLPLTLLPTRFSNELLQFYNSM